MDVDWIIKNPMHDHPYENTIKFLPSTVEYFVGFILLILHATSLSYSKTIS